ncbi:hypothetical protein ACFODL_19345 [Phenylobacterium terrae]|uniref:Uncharacterized protein n=1 Tax=Phenylobacterium terrae TaxID=2665495 RepID=A0ABW4N6B9_9CAUL
MPVKRWMWGAALALPLMAGEALAQAPADAEPGFSYCATYEGVNAASRAFITQVMPGRVTRTESNFHGDPNGPYTESRMEARLKASFDAAGIETHVTNPRCEGWPTRELAEKYRAEMAERWQEDGAPLFEFEYALTGGSVGNFTPYSGKRRQVTAAPPPSGPSNGPAIIVSGPTQAERAERRQEILRQEAEQKAERKRSEQRKAEEVRRQAEARAAFEAWKNAPSKSTPCGGPGQRGCGASRQ